MSDFEDPVISDQTSLDSLFEMWYSATVFGIHFGWLVLAAALLILYFWPQIQKKLDKVYEEKQNKAYDAKCKKDPDWYNSRQKAMEAARLRMQEELSRKAKEHAEKVKELAEKKRLEQLELLSDGGHRLGDGNSSDNSTNKKTKNSFRPEYHPLMGSGPSTTYRPPRRSCCPSGGCG